MFETSSRCLRPPAQSECRAMKRCPNCRLINPDEAERCDCGFDFETGSLVRLDRKPRKVSQGLRPTPRQAVVACVVGAVMGLVGGFVVTWHFGDWGPVNFTRSATGQPGEETLRAWHLWIPASVATWLLLIGPLSRASLGRTLFIGFASVFLGSALFWTAFAVQEVVTSRSDLLEALRTVAAAPLQGALMGYTLTWPVSVPIGLATALVLRLATRSGASRAGQEHAA